MNFSVKNVKPITDYNLLHTFESGEIKVFDMKPYLEFGLFSELKNKNIFNSVKISFDSIEWANQLDFDPEVLYGKSYPYIQK